jgi:hypothetical protein
VRLLLLLALAPACIDDHYTCTVDADCNLGSGGRCELDQHCTAYDATCPLGRRYTAHSGSASGMCFDDTVAPLDPCASGQPPAPASDACAATVCAALPACCATGWFDACVQQAERQCGLKCDTRIAVTAERNTLANPKSTELYDLRYDGTQWKRMQRRDNDTTAGGRREFLGWLAPAPGTNEPRLVGLDANALALVVGEGGGALAFPIGLDRNYDSMASVDFDRDGHDKAVLASYDATTAGDDVIDLSTGGEHELTISATPLESWGDYDADPFPDAVAAVGASQTYRMLQNTADGDDARRLASGIDSAQTVGEDPQVRSFEWIDLDGNGRLDLVVFGSDVQIHFGTPPDHLSDQASLRFDCDPPARTGSSTCTAPDINVAFAGTAIIDPDGTTSLILAVDNTTTATSRAMNVYRLHFSGMAPKTLDTLTVQPTCPTCVMRAFVARDLDGDGVLDLVAIDSNLNVYVAASRADPTVSHLVFAFALPTSLTAAPIVRAAVGGALR